MKRIVAALAFCCAALARYAAAAQDAADLARVKQAHDATLPYVWAALMIALYLAPAIVAFKRRHHNRSAIASLNVSVGWTFIGWVGALVWSLTAVNPSRQ